MSNHLFKQLPNWAWLCLIPVFGGLGLAYAGYTSKTPKWTKIGIGITIAAVIISVLDLPLIYLILWAAPFTIALNIKTAYLIKTAPRGSILPDNRKIAQLIAESKGKVDINKCSKDDLVHVLGLPIVYANNIESLKVDGYVFTHIEELTELADVPEKYCEVIEPLVAFNYYDKSAYLSNWQRLNQLPMSELIELGIDRDSAAVIVDERQLRGTYRSLLDVKKRTGLPLSLYKHII
jgi:DNA uptake protein ComE-like DNA-binding protein